MTSPVRVLIVDDSALYRQTIQNVLRDVDGLRVVGIARNGLEALQKIEECEPDLLTLDVQMPDMDGIQVLHEIKRRRYAVAAIMVSSFTDHGAQVTTDALLEGAFDFILKPSSSDIAANREQLKRSLVSKITAFRESGRTRRHHPCADRPVRELECEPLSPTTSTCRAIVIGTSTGGPEALKAVLPKLPADLSVPVFVVQHMPPVYTTSLARRLDSNSAISVVEGNDGMVAGGGMVILAPGGQQMGLRSENHGLRVAVTDAPPENAVRPAVDYLLRSATGVLRGDLLAIIMTGMGKDGLLGCRLVKQAGGCVFAQSQCDSVVYGMPKAVIDDCLADRILPLGKMAPAIVRHVKQSRRREKEIR